MSFHFLPHKALHACNTSSPAGMVLNDSALRELDMSPVLTVTLCLLIEARQPRRECRMIIFSSQRPKKTEYCYIASLSPSDSLAASLRISPSTAVLWLRMFFFVLGLRMPFWRENSRQEVSFVPQDFSAHNSFAQTNHAQPFVFIFIF